MSENKTEKMANFYEQCLQRGYVDMQDSVQSLKAKVIANDMGFDFRDIETLYQNSKRCYEQKQEEAERLRQAFIEAEKHRAVDGILLFTLFDGKPAQNNTKAVSVYVRPDKSMYHTVNDGIRKEGYPAISAVKTKVTSFDYVPSKAVFTGATVGGVTTGGVHYTQGGYKGSSTDFSNGELNVKTYEFEFVLDRLLMSDYICEKFKRDSSFCALVREKQIMCRKEGEPVTGPIYGLSAISSAESLLNTLNAMNMEKDKQRLPYSVCIEILNLLDRILRGVFPPDDEELYAEAEVMAKSEYSDGLKQAAERFSDISDYRDAASRAKECREKYEEVLQREKEQYILEQERVLHEKEIRRKKRRIPLLILCVVVVICIAAALIIPYMKAEKVQKEAYFNACQLQQTGQYEAAKEAFLALGEYEDSEQRLTELDYCMAEKLLENGDTAQAAIAFGRLGDYKDSCERSMELWDTFAVRKTAAQGQCLTVVIHTDGTAGALYYDNSFRGDPGYDPGDVTSWSNLIAVDADAFYCVGLKPDGTVISNSDKIQRIVSEWTDVVAISSAWSNVVGLRNDGTVVATKQTVADEMKSWRDIISVCTILDGAVGLKSDGTVVLAGKTSYQVSEWVDIVAISGNNNHIVGLKADGTVVAAPISGKATDEALNISEWKNVVAVTAGQHASIGLLEDGRLLVAGVEYEELCEFENVVGVDHGAAGIVCLFADGTVRIKYNLEIPNEFHDVRLPG